MRIAEHEHGNFPAIDYGSTCLCCPEFIYQSQASQFLPALLRSINSRAIAASFEGNTLSM